MFVVVKIAIVCFRVLCVCVNKRVLATTTTSTSKEKRGDRRRSNKAEYVRKASTTLLRVYEHLPISIDVCVPLEEARTRRRKSQR